MTAAVVINGDSIDLVREGECEGCSDLSFVGAVYWGTWQAFIDLHHPLLCDLVYSCNLCAFGLAVQFQSADGVDLSASFSDFEYSHQDWRSWMEISGTFCGQPWKPQNFERIWWCLDSEKRTFGKFYWEKMKAIWYLQHFLRMLLHLLCLEWSCWWQTFHSSTVAFSQISLRPNAERALKRQGRWHMVLAVDTGLYNLYVCNVLLGTVERSAASCLPFLTNMFMLRGAIAFWKKSVSSCRSLPQFGLGTMRVL